MTPKYYQRILRVKHAISFIKLNPQATLVDVTLENGFTDQAHMTREFTYIAKITPKKYSKLITYQ
jgi:transcriptional regulator GlxA family with amidase domain